MERQIEDWIDGYVEFTDSSESPESFRRWTAISTIAAALQRKCFVEWGTITWYPNMYIVLIGPSGARKGTAMGPAYDMLEELNIPMAANATTLQALIRRLRDTNHTEVNQETSAIQMHSSLTIFSKEFTVFLGYHNNELMASLCDWYDCDRVWKYETISRKTDEIRGVWVNLIGGTTPDLIKTSLPMDAIGGGLTSRMVCVYEEGKEKFVVLPLLTDRQRQLREQLYCDLEKISMLSGQFKYSPCAINKWTEWYTAVSTSPPVFTDKRLEGYVERRPTHIQKLAMIVSASRAHGPELTITAEDFNRAISLLEYVERKMPKVFSGIGKSDISTLIPEVMSWIAIQDEGKTDIAQLTQHFYHDADKVTLDRIIQTLVQMNYVTMDMSTRPFSLVINKDAKTN